MVSSRSHQIHLFWWLLLGLTASLATVSGQTIVRIVEASEPDTVDYTGQIHQFSEIGQGGSGTTPRPWVCYFQGVARHLIGSVVQWQTPSGSVVPSGSGQATGSQFFQIDIDNGLALLRGPDYNSPDGEYCCEITTVSGQRSCVTLTTCPMLPFLANGRITYDPVTNVATHSCDPGYALSNTGQRTCQSNDQWSGTTVTCERIMCPTLSNPVNGQVMVSTHAVGSVATYTCSEGYNLTGSSMRMCEQDSGVIGQWTLQPPTCPLVDCGAITHPPNGRVDTSSGTTYNQVATYSCDTGYNLVGSLTRTCQASGMWSFTAPVCELICPNLPPPVNGAVTYSDPTIPRDEGSTVTYSCNTGYALVGNSVRTCTSSGWSGRNPLCRAICPDLTLTNGVISYSPDATPRLEGTIATHSCDVGYELSGRTGRTCQFDRTWSGGVITCIGICSNLTLNNGIITITPMGFPILAGAVATHSCSDGYLLSGEMNRTCMTRPTGGGVWGGDALMCRVTVVCDVLPNITNAVITYSPSTSPRLMDSVATHTCQLDLPLMGNAQRTCQADRSWSGAEPYCQRVFFQLGGSSVVTRNIEMHISEVGAGDGGLVCRTDHPHCCDNSTDTIWLSPNNTVISSTRGDGDFYTTRGDGYITLNRYSNTTSSAGMYCCVVPVRGGSVQVFCAVLTLPGSGAPASSDPTVGLSVAIAVILVVSLTTIVTLVIILIIRRRQLQEARTQLMISQQSHSKQLVYESPSQVEAVYEDTSKMDVGGASDHTHTPAMELSQCPAYAPL